jgi:DNA primase
MKRIEEVARELEAEGWRILWQSEVEALAIKKEALGVQDMNILELIDNLGIKLKRAGKEYMGLCPFHDDHNPSLSVNKEKGLWHCFGCGKSGDVHKFVEEWQELRH